eukprot:COSAG01_NODE_51640_length_352_cov_0.799213_1_plen_56_part_10
MLEKLTIVTPKELIGTESYKKTLTFPRDRPTRTGTAVQLVLVSCGVQLYVYKCCMC